MTVAGAGAGFGAGPGRDGVGEPGRVEGTGNQLVWPSQNPRPSHPTPAPSPLRLSSTAKPSPLRLCCSALPCCTLPFASARRLRSACRAPPCVGVSVNVGRDGIVQSCNHESRRHSGSSRYRCILIQTDFASINQVCSEVFPTTHLNTFLTNPEL